MLIANSFGQQDNCAHRVTNDGAKRMKSAIAHAIKNLDRNDPSAIIDVWRRTL